ncbi:hypothetical protein C1I95_32330 [Micromonospora craterilacus]|uniref:Uncharacterized protein n=1 Tax=Micromonospora craterilacus TaxID=1655439 RepID=A0A2W2DPQ0_9ACTN|nr:hypothetical protein [Micromonospora craterilacus]PZG06089.1 hypothetical protein C1I95_32330 [Micromonospora craterilacus]
MNLDTIHIPTRDFLGILTDVAGLAGQDKDIPETYAVCLEWDGEQLHAMAGDDVRMGVSSWHPDELPEEAAQDGLSARRGGLCDPWKIVIGVPDVKDMAATFKVSDKNWWVPLALDYMPGYTDRHKLRVARSTNSGLPGKTMVVLDRDVNFADVRRILAAEPAPQKVSDVLVNGELFAAFGAVRQRGGAMKLTFADGQVRVTVGERFVGQILAARAARRLKPVAA